MAPSPPPAEMLQKRDSLLNSLNEIIRSLATVHMEVADFIQEYSAKKDDQSATYTSKAELREKEDQRAKEYVKHFKSVLNENRNANNIANLKKCFDSWMIDLLPIFQKKKREQAEDFLDIPTKMAGLFFFYGDHYRALICMKSMLTLQPYCYEARYLIMRWCIYLGELEMAENAFAYEKKMNKKYKMNKDYEAHLEILQRVCAAFVKFNRNDAREKDMEVINEEVIQMAEHKQNTYFATEMTTLLAYMRSHFAKVPATTETPIDQSTIDPLYSLTTSWISCDILVRNRLRGIFTDESRLDLDSLFKNSLGCLEILSCFAEYSIILRDAATEYLNHGMIRDSLGLAEGGLKLSYKMGCFPRALEFANLSLLAITNMSTDSAPLSLATAKSRLQILCAPVSVASSPARCKSPSRIVTSAAHKFLESFEELKIADDAPPKRIHNISCSKPCDVCTMYKLSSDFAIDYHMALVQYHDYDQNTLSQMQQQFVKIRESAMPLQQYILDKSVRPRPPMWMCEIFCICAVHWLRCDGDMGREHINDTKKADFRSLIVSTATKIAGYSTIRLISYLLAVRQVNRHDSLAECITLPYSWMEYSSTEASKTTTPHPATPQRRRNVKGSVLEKAVAEATDDYVKYQHLFYRDWRFPTCTFIARLSKDPWQSALMWSESTVLSTRQAARLVSGKVDRFAFSRPSSFEAHMNSLPGDYTIVQLATDEFGNLWLVKLYSERDPIVIPICHYKKVLRVKQKMTSLLKENDASANIAEGAITANQFWENRRTIEKKLQEIVNAVRPFLFRGLAPLLLPSRSLSPRGKKLASSLISLVSPADSKFSQTIAEELVSLVSQTDKSSAWDSLIEVIGEFCGLSEEQTDLLKREYPRLRQRVSSVGVINVHPTLFTFLVICPILASVPFEMLDLYGDRPHVGRIVSVHALFKQLAKSPSLPRRVDVGNSYYILDPDNSLTATQKRMTDFLKKFKLKDGVVGQAPSNDQLKSILESKDMVFYLGHGSGSKHMSKKTIKASSCNAVTVLMGCSSVCLDYDGWGLDGKCTAYDYTIAHCPAVVGCLWMVTDGEIDRYFMALVQSCFSSGANTTFDGSDRPRLRNLMDAMRKARHQAKLPYLTGASVVCFGIPVTSSE